MKSVIDIMDKIDVHYEGNFMEIIEGCNNRDYYKEIDINGINTIDGIDKVVLQCEDIDCVQIDFFNKGVFVRSEMIGIDNFKKGVLSENVANMLEIPTIEENELVEVPTIEEIEAEFEEAYSEIEEEYMNKLLIDSYDFSDLKSQLRAWYYDGLIDIAIVNDSTVIINEVFTLVIIADTIYFGNSDSLLFTGNSYHCKTFIEDLLENLL